MADEKYARRFGNVTASGDMDVTVNGQTVRASGNDIGNMAAVTAGLSNLRRKRGDVSLNENNGNVVLGGKDTGVKAEDFAAGADDEGFERLRKGYTKNSGDEIVRGRQAAESSGLGNLVRWDKSSNRMTIAGVDVPYLYITNDGNAMVSEKTLNSVLEKVKENLGVKTAAEIADEIYSRNGRNINKALDSIINRKEWEYNPETDPAYLAYQKQYTRNAEQAYNRAMGTGGLYGSPSSYQMYQALAGYADNMQKMSDAIPEFQNVSYERYSDEQERNLKALEALQKERAEEYDMYNSANESLLDRIKDSDAENYKRYGDSVYTYPLNKEQLRQARLKNELSENEKLRSDMDTDMYQAMLDVDYRIKNAQLSSVQVKTLISQIQAAQQRAMLYNGGMFMKADMDALGIPRNYSRYPDSGGYPSPWDYGINAKLAEWANGIF